MSVPPIMMTYGTDMPDCEPDKNTNTQALNAAKIEMWCSGIQML